MGKRDGAAGSPFLARGKFASGLVPRESRAGRRVKDLENKACLLLIPRPSSSMLRRVIAPVLLFIVFHYFQADGSTRKRANYPAVRLPRPCPDMFSCRSSGTAGGDPLSRAAESEDHKDKATRRNGTRITGGPSWAFWHSSSLPPD